MKSYGSPTRTGADRLQDAIMFVGMARDHVIRTHTPESVALMKGVTTKAGIAAIEAQFAKRMEGMADV